MTCLADLRKKDEDGNTGFIKLAMADEFNKVVEIAEKDTSDKLKISDLTHRNDTQMDVLLALGFAGNLSELFDVSLWKGRAKDVVEIKEKLSESFQAQVDFSSVFNQLNLMSVKKAENHRILKRRPRI